MKKEDLPKEFIDRIERFNKLFEEGTKNTDNPHNFEEDDLFKYEMFCIEESLKLIEIFKNKDNLNKFFEEAIKEEGEDHDLEDFMEFLKRKYNLNLSKDHTGNTIYASYVLAHYYINSPQLVPYMHGVLARLVGDEGYYDNRMDVPKITD